MWTASSVDWRFFAFSLRQGILRPETVPGTGRNNRVGVKGTREAFTTGHKEFRLNTESGEGRRPECEWSLRGKTLWDRGETK